MMLVTLADAKRHLRVDDTNSDTEIEFMIRAASSAVIRYIANGADSFTDSFGDPYEDSNGIAMDIPEDVQHATLLLVGEFYKNREPNSEERWEHGYLPRPVLALLYPYRTPTLR